MENIQQYCHRLALNDSKACFKVDSFVILNFSANV